MDWKIRFYVVSPFPNIVTKWYWVIYTKIIIVRRILKGGQTLEQFYEKRTLTTLSHMALHNNSK